MSDSTVQDLLFGRYEVRDKLGTGPHAEVFRVRDALNGTYHALKVLKTMDQEQSERLFREGQIQSQLHHRHICRVINVLHDKNEVVLVMDYIPRPTLRELLDSGKPLPFEDALTLFHQILAGVDAAHQAGIIHRDLEPNNVILSDEHGEIVAKIIDFGLAKPTFDADAGLTHDDSSLGLAGYMAPEQARDSKSVTVRADIWSLGCLLYELLAGKPAFLVPGNLVATLQATSSGQCVPIEEVAPEVPFNVAAAVGRALSFDPEQRFESCAEFALALYGTALESQPAALSLGILQDRTETPIDETASAAFRRPPGARKNRLAEVPKPTVDLSPPAEPPPEPSHFSRNILLAALAVAMVMAVVSMLLV